MVEVEILGGSHDGERYALASETELLLPRLKPFAWKRSPDEVLVEVEVYGPATEADALLHRWSLLRVEHG